MLQTTIPGSNKAIAKYGLLRLQSTHINRKHNNSINGINNINNSTYAFRNLNKNLASKKCNRNSPVIPWALVTTIVISINRNLIIRKHNDENWTHTYRGTLENTTNRNLMQLLTQTTCTSLIENTISNKGQARASSIRVHKLSFSVEAYWDNKRGRSPH